jgi:hypothetical protein
MIVGIPQRKRELKTPISHQRVLVVEGNDDAYLMEKILTHAGHNTDDFEILNIVGDNIHQTLPVLLNNYRQEFEMVKSFAIIWDADRDRDLAFRNIVELLRSKSDMPIPERPGTMVRNEKLAVGVYLVPGDGPGKLEDLFLRSQVNHVAMPCVNRFFDCLKVVLPDKEPHAQNDPKIPCFPKDIDKAKCLALMAAFHESPWQIGIAAQWKYWNLEHQCLASLKAFLEEWMRRGA